MGQSYSLLVLSSYDRARRIRLCEAVSPVSERLAQSGFNLDAHIIGLMPCRHERAHMHDPFGFELDPL
jgi:hypothetical protein